MTERSESDSDSEDPPDEPKEAQVSMVAGERRLPTLPKHPGRWLFALYTAAGATTMAGAGLAALTGADGVLFVGLLAAGGLHLALGLEGLRSGPGTQLVNAAANQVALGRIDVAEKLLERAERSRRGAAVRRAAHVVRATIALKRGDPEKARDEADRALLIGTGFFTRQGAWFSHFEALSLRAFSRAVIGDAAGAREDVARMNELLRVKPPSVLNVDAHALFRGGARAFREPLARAMLAEAVLLAQEGDRARLRAHLTEHHALLIEGTGPRERALVRGFERMLAAPTSTPYRRILRDRQAPAGDPGLEDWVERVLPDVAPFVRANAISAAAEIGGIEESAAKAPAPTEAAPRDWGSAKRIGTVLGLWVLMMVALGGLWAATELTGAPRGPATFLTIALPMLFMAAIVGFTVLRTRSLFRRRRALADELIKLARSPSTVSGETTQALATLAKGPEPMTAAQASLAQATLANRQGDFRGAAEHATRGLIPMQRRLMRVFASEVLLPALITERAIAHAALGQADDAIAEVEAIPEDVATRGRSVFSVKLLALANEGRLVDAAKLIQESSLEAPLDPPIEALSDIVRATSFPQGLGPSDLQRLREDLRTSATLRVWLLAAAPRALAAFDDLGAGPIDAQVIRTRIEELPTARETAASPEREALEREALRELSQEESDTVAPAMRRVRT